MSDRTDCPVCTKPLSEHENGLACCPFCGCRDTVALVPKTCKRDDEYNPLDIAFPRAVCTNCHTARHGVDWDHGVNSARDAWNRRAETAAERIVAECLRAMPVGNIKTHTPESLPSRISDMASALAAKTAAREDKLGCCENRRCRGFSQQVNHDYCLHCKRVMQERERFRLRRDNKLQKNQIDYLLSESEKAEARVQELEAHLTTALKWGVELLDISNKKYAGAWKFETLNADIQAARAAIAKQDQNQKGEADER